MKLSLCVMGCGGYARLVLRDIHDLTNDFDFYFASRDEAKAKAYCEEYGGAGYFGSYEAAVQDPRVDAVYFFTPHHVHLENALLATQHSKHILMEKPIARTVEESRHMIEAARDAGIRLMVAENYRFLPAVQKCKEVMQAGNIGDLRLINIQAEGFRAPEEWRLHSELTGGGVFIDGGIHFVDILLYLGGFPERVYAAMPPQVHKASEGEDGIAMMARLPCGSVGIINFSRATPLNGQQHLVAVTGSKGYITFEPYGSELAIETPAVKRTVRLPQAYRGVRGMVKEFKASIQEGREPVTSGEEGLKDLAIVLAAYESANQGGEVALTPP
jgi:predicted dehydrogenase